MSHSLYQIRIVPGRHRPSRASPRCSSHAVRCDCRHEPQHGRRRDGLSKWSARFAYPIQDSPHLRLATSTRSGIRAF